MIQVQIFSAPNQARSKDVHFLSFVVLLLARLLYGSFLHLTLPARPKSWSGRSPSDLLSSPYPFTGRADSQWLLNEQHSGVALQQGQGLFVGGTCLSPARTGYGMDGFEVRNIRTTNYRAVCFWRSSHLHS